MKIRMILAFVLFMACMNSFGQGDVHSVIGSSGAYYSGAGNSLSWTLGEAVIETFTSSQNILTQGFQQPFHPYVISGQLTYSNAANSPMDSTMVYLLNPLGQKVDSSFTNSSGHYYFFDVTAGTYTFSMSVTKPWGSVNAIDALWVLRHFVQIIQLTGMYEQAANVDNSVVINSNDALLISRRFVGLIDHFLIPDWIYTDDTISFSLNPVTHDLKAICAGDVNGSYIVP